MLVALLLVLKQRFRSVILDGALGIETGVAVVAVADVEVLESEGG